MHIIFVRARLRGCERGGGRGGQARAGRGVGGRVLAGGCRAAGEDRVTARLLHATSSRHFFIIIALRWNLFQQGSVIE